MDDYLISGPQQALDVITDITGARRSTSSACASVARSPRSPPPTSPRPATTESAPSRCSTPCSITPSPDSSACSPTRQGWTRLEKEMAKSGGTLPGKSMAGTFDVLRANDLIFNYVVSNWLLGQKPPAFDILAWNNDSTVMPAAMHTFYLRNFYVKNLLAQGELEIAGPHNRPERGEVERVHRQREERPHRALGIGLQDHRIVLRSNPVRTQQRRAHRRNRQPARPEGMVSLQRRQPHQCRRLDAGRRTHHRILVDRLGQPGPASTPVRWSHRPRSAAANTRCSATDPENTSSPERRRRLDDTSDFADRGGVQIERAMLPDRRVIGRQPGLSGLAAGIA